MLDQQPSKQTPSWTFGLFLNMGANLGSTTEDVFRFTLTQAELADDLGYHDLWVTEHHFIPFGINPSALTASAFLLGRTKNLRVGTAVALSPLYHPLDLAERTAVIDQFSGGRFDLGIGRGGYLKDYSVFSIDTARWDQEPDATAEVLLNAWQHREVGSHNPHFCFDHVAVQPPPFTKPHPPLYLATSSERGIAFAAEHGLGLQHYFATPAQQRLKVETQYRDLYRSIQAPPAHVHTLITLITDDEKRVRCRLTEALTKSFQDGDWPAVPQSKNRHVDQDGNPLDRRAMAAGVAQSALIGSPEQVALDLKRFMAQTGARRLVLYMEAVAEVDTTLTSIQRFATEVIPLLSDDI